ncbi:hypothetical protein HRI_004136800 [Hibiscus trionum]|uniref:Ribosome-inactivating protein n=1 Tax=Hibiscus trionum TaxID=183268 RepID=A0A9W7MPG5_HIBTR|nr:hypothetical protein HRI_004136800 [Hibiscus trionum]
MKASFHQHQTMKVWVVLTVAVLWVCSRSMVEPRSSIPAVEDIKKPTVDKVIFDTWTATRLNYMYFMSDLRTALLRYGSADRSIALLPDRSSQPMQLTDPRRYLMVELSNGTQVVTLALDVTNVYVLGYRAGTGPVSYFFSSVSQDVRSVLFPNTETRTLPFDENYDALEAAAGVADRRDILLGIGELRQHIQNMNYYQPTGSDVSRIARALIVCVQMVSEAARFRNIEQRIAQVADPRYGVYSGINPDGLVMEFQTNWRRIATAIQSATNGIFRTAVHLVYDGGQELVLDTVASVRFLVAIMPVVCLNRGANLQLMHIPAKESSTSLEDDTCDIALAPTSLIMGQNGLCIDVFQGLYHNGNKIILWKCGQNQANQLWTLRSDDNTIQSGGKCLTTYGYSSRNYVMIYDCDTAVSDATKWEIQSDGTIRNPHSGLVLTTSKDDSGMINLVVDYQMFGSKQTFYASNNTKPSVTTIVGYKGLCLLASGSRVWLENCVSNDDEQQWTIYPDGTIRPQKDQNGCLKYGDSGGDSVTVGTCDGWTEERWIIRSDGTILHFHSERMMDVKDTSASLLEITANERAVERLSQIWFLVRP